eukprot:GHVH01017511.1.p1 GENE.GHVH01017511.1~~GHVH01017511.1.p1  ORF type:complete len:613 (+),score=62.95 GHVH01017511.1:52-1890(+)
MFECSEGIEDPSKGKTRQWGVTPPISYECSKEEDRVKTCELESFLRSNGCFESGDGYVLRRKVLAELEEVINIWLKGATYPEDCQNAQLLSFGSYQLGVVMPASDIDLCCLVSPKHEISRSQFFTEIGSVLRLDERVSKLVVVIHAHTPVMKMKFRNVSLDLLFCALDDPPDFVRPGNLTHSDVGRDEILKSADDQIARSINGVRVATKILQLVPDVETYRLALRFIKYWARMRGVYSNIFGYLGGVAYSIMVARICQLYPNFAASQIVARFFKIYHAWNWRIPVHLCEMESVKEGLEHLSVWAPGDETGTGRGQLMPVVTPAYPVMCATHNVSNPTKRILLQEVSRCHELIHNHQDTLYSVLAAPYNIFQHYEIFLTLEIFGDTVTSFETWIGFLESKVRSYCNDLSQMDAISEVRLFPERIPLKYSKQVEPVSSSDEVEDSTTRKRPPTPLDSFSGSTKRLKMAEGAENVEEGQLDEEEMMQNLILMGFPNSIGRHRLPIDQVCAGYNHAAAMVIGIEPNLEYCRDYNILDVRHCSMEFMRNVTHNWPESVIYDGLVNTRVRAYHRHELPQWIENCPLIWREGSESNVSSDEQNAVNELSDKLKSSKHEC